MEKNDVQRPDLMTITMPESIKKMLNDLKDKDEKSSRSKIIHRLIVREANLQSGSKGHEIILNEIQDIAINLHHYRILTVEEYSKIFKIVEEAKKRIKNKEIAETRLKQLEDEQKQNDELEQKYSGKKVSELTWEKGNPLLPPLKKHKKI